MKQNQPDIRPNPQPSISVERVKGDGRKALRFSSIDFVKYNPLDTLWRLSLAEGYKRERLSQDELHLSVSGEYSDYHLSFSWCPTEEELQLFLVFDGRINGGRTDKVCRLTSLINERLVVGHFDYWGQEKALVYRHSMSLAGMAKLTMEQAMSMIASALSAAEKGYPACQYVMWAGMTPEDALDSVLLEKAARL